MPIREYDDAVVEGADPANGVEGRDGKDTTWDFRYAPTEGVGAENGGAAGRDGKSFASDSTPYPTQFESEYGENPNTRADDGGNGLALGNQLERAPEKFATVPEAVRSYFEEAAQKYGNDSRMLEAQLDSAYLSSLKARNLQDANSQNVTLRNAEWYMTGYVNARHGNLGLLPFVLAGPIYEYIAKPTAQALEPWFPGLERALR